MTKVHIWAIIAAVMAMAAAYPVICQAANWGPEVELTPWTFGGSWTTSNNARGLAASNDTVYFVWHDFRWSPRNYGCWIYFKFYDGTSWSADTVIGAFNTSRFHNWNASCVVDETGRLHVVWESNDINYPNQGNDDIVYRYRQDGVWSAATKLTTHPQFSWYPTIACGPGGKLYVFWQDNREGTFKIFSKTYDGSSWSQDTCLDELCVAAGYPSAAATNGYPALAWQDFRTGINQIFFRMSTAAGWGTDSSVSNSPAGAFTPCLMSDGGGNLHLVWEDWRDGNGEIYYRQLERSAMAWGPVVRLTADPWHSRSPVLTCRGDTLVDVFWADDRDGNYEIYNLQCRTGAWGSEQRLTFQDAFSLCPSATADARGNLHLAWADGRGDLGYAPNIFFMSDIENPWPKGASAAGPKGPAISEFTIRPNPAGQQACFEYSVHGLNGQGRGEIRIYNVAGQAVARLGLPGVRGGGRVTWDCKTGSGRPVAAGVYLARLSVGGAASCRRFMVVR